MREIILTNTADRCLVDDEDYEPMSAYKWFLSERNGYVMSNQKHGQKAMRMHRLLLGDPYRMVIDHINRNKLDNRRSNLRIVTARENSWNKGIASNNTSGVTGVAFGDGKWYVQIRKDRRQLRVGTYESKETAIAVRKAAEKLLFLGYWTDTEETA